jgi:hypothetical protein
MVTGASSATTNCGGAPQYMTKIYYGPRFDARRQSKEAKDYPEADGMLDRVYGGRR